jgi:hypothetical protein
VAEVPDHLRELFLTAPYTAARRVFDAALTEDADFMVLSGDILHPTTTGPHGPLFLVEQFTRLLDRGIRVYWATGTVDPPEAWPSALPLPQNVCVFPSDRVEEVRVHRNDVPVARLMGVGPPRQYKMRARDFSSDAAELYSIAVLHGQLDPSIVQQSTIDYWALGGRHARSAPAAGSPLVHYCGSTQGRDPEESGIHGCTLVEVDEKRHARTTLLPTEVARWLNERIVLPDAASRDDLRTRLRDRMQTLREGSPSTALLISWVIADEKTTPVDENTTNTVQPPSARHVPWTQQTAELLESLRAEYGHGSSPAWSISCERERADTLPAEWYEQETIRGDFLRAIRQLRMNPAEPLGLDSLMTGPGADGTARQIATHFDPAGRDRMLREAAVLGVDLLSGEGPRS